MWRPATARTAPPQPIRQSRSGAAPPDSGRRTACATRRPRAGRPSAARREAAQQCEVLSPVLAKPMPGSIAICSRQRRPRQPARCWRPVRRARRPPRRRRWRARPSSRACRACASGSPGSPRRTRRGRGRIMAQGRYVVDDRGAGVERGRHRGRVAGVDRERRRRHPAGRQSRGGCGPAPRPAATGRCRAGSTRRRYRGCRRRPPPSADQLRSRRWSMHRRRR